MNSQSVSKTIDKIKFLNSGNKLHGLQKVH